MRKLNTRVFSVLVTLLFAASSFNTVEANNGTKKLFVRVQCYTIYNGFTITAKAGNFLTSEEKAVEKCAAKLNKIIAAMK